MNLGFIKFPFMSKLHLKVITPKKKVLETEVLAVSAPSSQGEITILPRHTNLFCLLKEGVVKIEKEKGEDFLSIGGGYLQTNGKVVNILVSRAYGQSEIDERLTAQAIEEAKKILQRSKDEKERAEATSILKRSLFDMKILKKRKRRRRPLETMESG